MNEFPLNPVSCQPLTDRRPKSVKLRRGTPIDDLFDDTSRSVGLCYRELSGLRHFRVARSKAAEAINSRVERVSSNHRSVSRNAIVRTKGSVGLVSGTTGAGTRTEMGGSGLVSSPRKKSGRSMQNVKGLEKK
ncbi:hypothetical protein NE237_005566 [Protea cynaroides]|uniref:Uncharacterized protein n=1 Tax=Protea cynaroides TaxID=273540 RepID=A0A9Q0GQF3_9MAGN|nr:hypothetical protein NE237_005566 [Protea cynaroides]